MPVTVNSNRYAFTTVKSGVSDFQKASGVLSYYLLRRPDGKLFVRSSTGSFDDEVAFSYDPSVPAASFPGSNISFSVNSETPLNLSVSSVGKNPYKSGNLFDCVYYSYFDTSAWSSLGSDSRLEDVFPSYAVLVVPDNSRMFFVLQIESDCYVYEIFPSYIERRSQISNFYMYDAVKFGNDIIVCGAKTGTSYSSESVYEESISDYYRFYEGSPSALVCLSSFNYEQFSSFGQNRSAFPCLCKTDRKNVSLCVNGDFLHISCLAYYPTTNAFVPCHCFSKHGSSWRYFREVRPFGLLYNVARNSICVRSDNVVYSSCGVSGDIYLTYYSFEENRWLNYDRTMKLTFDDATRTSSSSSSS